MMKEEAIRRAVEYVQAEGLHAGPLEGAWHLDLAHLDRLAEDCDPEMLETYHRLRKDFRDQWVVSFKVVTPPGTVVCPATMNVQVYADGRVTRSLLPLK